MIFTPDEQTCKRPLDADGDELEPPPSYSPTSSSSPAFTTQPTNFLTLTNDHDAIRGEFVIDPTLVIPASVLPPLPANAPPRRNLCLTSEHSAVHADIWLLSGARGYRTSLALFSGHGAISAQVRTLGTTPFALTAHAPHGGVRLALPRSFHGLLSLSTEHGSITLSNALVERATQLSRLDNARRYFIGDFSALDEGTWDGDVVEVEAPHGSIRFKYVDEAVGQQKRGVLSRLFGK